MRFEVQVGALRDAVSRAKVTTDTVIPINQGLYLEAVIDELGGRLSVYSMKSTAKSLFTIPASVAQPGTIVIRGAQLLAGLFGHSADALVNLHFSTKMNRLCGKCCGSNFTVSTMNGIEQLGLRKRELPKAFPEASIFQPALIRGVVKRAAWCTDEDPDNPRIIPALGFKKNEDGYRVLATDGYIGVRVDVKTETGEGGDLVIERAALDVVSSFLGKEAHEYLQVLPAVPVDGKVREMYFHSPGFLYASSVLHRQMPDFEGLFTRPEFQPERKLLVSRASLLECFKRLSGFVERTSPSVKLTLNGKMLTLSTASTDGDAVEHLEIDYTDDSPKKERAGKVSISISNEYMLKVLTSLESDLLVLGIRNERSPLFVIDSNNDEIDTLYLLMSVVSGLDASEEEDGEEAVEVQSEAEAPSETAAPVVEIPAIAAQAPEVEPEAEADPSEDDDDDLISDDILDSFNDLVESEGEDGSQGSEIPVASDKAA